MNCEQIVDEIIAQSGGRALTPDVESHLRSCQACSKVRLEQQALWRHMDAWEAPEVSPGFDRRLDARIGRRTAAPWVWLFRPLQPAFSAALACMLLIATVVVENGRHVQPPVETVAVGQAEDVKQIETALDDIRMLNEFEILPLEQSGEGKS